MSTEGVPPPSTPETPEAPTPPPPPPINWGYWLRRLLVCNPFFLCSAALLLLAINRLYNDPNFLNGETQKLLFNFGALQVYELLLVGVAILLAGRKIWYDSALLVVLENGLLLLPFMLISQAALIDDRLGWALTIAGGAAVSVRFAALKRWYSEFNLPWRALALGAMLLLINVALPRVFRSVIAVDYYNWHLPNLIAWYVVLPTLAAGANLLPRPTRYGGINPERHWLPLFLYAVWIIGTAVHIWSVGHIAERPFEFPLLAPVIWVSAWTLWNRLTDCLPSPSASLQKGVLMLAFVAPFLGARSPAVFSILCFLNGIMFLVLYFRKRNPMAREFAIASLLLAFAGLPLGVAGLSRGDHIAIAVIGYCIILRSRNPEAGLLGALAIGVAVAWLARSWSPGMGVQAAFVFFLVHSLRWRDDTNRPDRAIRNLAALIWVIHALIWTRNGWPESSVAAAGGIIVLSVWSFHLWRRKPRTSVVLPICSCGTLLSGPANWFFDNSSPGLIALAASFSLFALGTLLALTRHKWDRSGELIHQAPKGQE